MPTAQRKLRNISSSVTRTAESQVNKVVEPELDIARLLSPSLLVIQRSYWLSVANRVVKDLAHATLPSTC